MTIARLRLRLLWLTLFALGLQIVVADFHHHITRGPGMDGGAVSAGICRPLGDRCAPIKPHHDDCLLCWAAAIAATSLTPVLFEVPAPAVIAGIRLRVIDPPQMHATRLADARARGPPSIDFG